jgi:hypothetical protein
MDDILKNLFKMYKTKTCSGHHPVIICFDCGLEGYCRENGGRGAGRYAFSEEIEKRVLQRQVEAING